MLASLKKQRTVDR